MHLYFDYAASAPLLPKALVAMEGASQLVGNPSSPHGFGRKARYALEEARERLARFVECDPEQVIWTSGATEANALVCRWQEPLFVSSLEHPSVLAHAPQAHRFKVTRQGVVDQEALKDLLLPYAGTPFLVSLMAANNETGVIQPLDQVVPLVKSLGGFVHADCVQWIGKKPFSFRRSRLDFATLSSHKMGGPKGVGALIAAGECLPLLKGGGQEGGRRAGTESVASIVGFASLLDESLLESHGKALILQQDLENSLKERYPQLVVLGEESPRVAISCLACPGVPADLQMIALDREGVAVGVGSACSSGRIGPSHVLQAMGVEEEVERCAIRVSLGWGSTRSALQQFLALYTQCMEWLMSRST